MELFLLALVLWHSFVSSTCFQDFAEPLAMAIPRSDGVYEFNLTIQEKLTMSTDGLNGAVEVLDYNPDDFYTMPWRVRDSDQNTPCDQSYTWNTSYHDLSSLLQLHGLHQTVFAINNKVPADPIVVPLGAEVLLRVHNNLLSAAVTLHVHGLDKKGLWYTDGVAWLQQCPIPPKTIYEYRFIADTPGTHWFHGHLGMDRGHGLNGAFIVKNREKEEITLEDGKFAPQRDYVMVLQEWTVAESNYIWHAQRWRTHKWHWGFDLEKLGRCWAPTRTYDFGAIGGVVPIRTILVNSHGWHDQEDTLNRAETLPLERFRIKQNEKVLFRVINAAGSHMLMLTVEGHRFSIVAADGFPLKPQEVDMLIVMPGERYDVVINGIRPERSRYWMTLETLEHYNKTASKIEPFYGAAALIYEEFTGKDVGDVKPDWSHKQRCTRQSKCVVQNCPFEQFPREYNYTCRHAVDFESLEELGNPIIGASEGLESAQYDERFINIHYDSHMNGWMFQGSRGIPYYYHNNLEEVTKPCNRTACPADSDNRFDDACFCFYHLDFELGALVQLTLYNIGYGGGYTNGYAHPFHMHGRHFYVLKMGFPAYNATNFISESNPDIDCSHTRHCNDKTWSNSSWLNGRVPEMSSKNPTFRDTIPVPMGGYVVIRFIADNPGWWYAHCHLMLHQMAGMAFAMKVGTHEQMSAPPDNFPHSCGDYKTQPLDPALKNRFQNV